MRTIDVYIRAIPQEGTSRRYGMGSPVVLSLALKLFLWSEAELPEKVRVSNHFPFTGMS
ncbi:MAG: hypothetical protein VX257_00605 [Planctomycetota bacterium]|nr:hypothetical protein [Planctomycetota bacterium]